jgi:hypothetical protein
MSLPQRPEARESPIREQRGAYRSSLRRPRAQDEEAGYISVATAPLSPSPIGHERSKPSYSETLTPLTSTTTQEQLAPTARSHTPGGYVIPGLVHALF